MSDFVSKTIVRVVSKDDYYFGIGEDMDGLGNVEIRYFEKTFNSSNQYEQLKRMSFDPACVDNLINGLKIVSDSMKR